MSLSPLHSSPSLPLPLRPIGLDVLGYLTSAVVIIPLFKKLKASPILGFLVYGFILKQLNVINDLRDIEAISGE
jgi:Kef-type K+ transport system membrane component KefB